MSPTHDLDSLGFDEELKAVTNFFLNPPTPIPDGQITVELVRQIWNQFSSILNRGAPDRPVERGVILRESPERNLTADIYLPDGDGPHPTVLFIHGGAWTAGAPATHHKLTCRFAEAGYLTVSVDYALAPEYPYPVALEDCLYAADWVRNHISEYNGDVDRLGISGDSAGANLSAALISKQLERNHKYLFKCAVLIYGVYDWNLLERIPIGSPFTDWKGGERNTPHYLGKNADKLKSDSGVSPAYSPCLSDFPPCQLLVGTNDPLLPQSLTFTADLQKAGVETELKIYEGMPHAFLQIEEFSECRQAQQDMWFFLKKYITKA